MTCLAKEISMKNHEFYMQKCIELAKNGEGKVSPNPFVGAVVVDSNGNIISEGYHQQYGGAHAEPNALNQVREKAIGATLYVNLEPCSHWGKTPPCADLIIEYGIKNLIVGMQDPNPIVTGNGIKKCKDAGINVITGILEEECKTLNEIFIKNMTRKAPFVAIKTATTTDGKIATKNGSSKWITGEASRAYVQKIRNKYDAILTSSNTIKSDNPSLTCRMENGRNPVRIILDTNLTTPVDSKVYNDDGTRVILAANSEAVKDNASKYPKHVEIMECPSIDNRINLEYLISELYKKGINSILVEAGGVLNGAFLQAKLVDKIYQFIAPKILGDKNAKNWVEGFDLSDINDCINLINVDVVESVSNDRLVVYRLLNT